jgi:triacylglycerol lipase
MTRESVALVLIAAALAGCSHGGSSGGYSASTAPASSSATPATSPGVVSQPPVYGTRHCWPIVLVHGFGGFKNVGPLEYWYHIPEALRAQGFEVFVVSDTSVSTVEERGQELVNQILAQYPDSRTKVNLIGHSMGGLDCRYAVSSLGLAGRVASVTTIGTPNRGSSVADVIFGLVPGPTVSLANLFLNQVGYDLDGGRELTTVYVDGTFNPQNPDAPGVAYFSWAGVADSTGAQTGCAVEPMLLPSWSILTNLEGANDGLVSVTSASWGTFEGTVAADHYNLVGQPIGATSFDQVKFFGDWAAQLEAQGFGP